MRQRRQRPIVIAHLAHGAVIVCRFRSQAPLTDLNQERKVLTTTTEKTLAWIAGLDGNVYSLVRDQCGSYAITCGGVLVRRCSGYDAAQSMEILMAMAALDWNGEATP